MRNWILDDDELDRIMQLYENPDAGDEPNGGAHEQPQNIMEHEIIPAAQAPGHFRFNATKVALTYPRCPIPKEAASKFFAEIWVNRDKIKFLMISRETHNDDGLTMEEKETEFHLHMYIEFVSKVDFRNPNIFDLPSNEAGKTYHPNIQTAYRPKGWIHYLMKEDEEPLVLGTTLQGIIAKYGEPEKKKTFRDEIGERLINGEATIEEVVKEYPRLLWDIKNLTNNLKIFQGMKNSKEIKDFKPLTKDKKRHYWIYGPSNTGKSTVLKALINHQPELWYQMPRNDDWVGYGKEPYLWFDEFNGRFFCVQDLNSICEGGLQVNVKGASSWLAEWPTVFILSNYSPQECYAKAFEGKEDLEKTLLNRFITIETSDPNWPDQLVNIYPPEHSPVLPRAGENGN